MSWIWLVLGLVLGPIVTTALIALGRRSAPDAPREGYLSRVALSVIATALVASIVLLRLEAGMGAGQSGAGIWLGGGWLLGGLTAIWYAARSTRQP